MSHCEGCGGIVGRDCFNPDECVWISRDVEARAAAARIADEDAYTRYIEECEAEHHAQMSNLHALTTDAQWGAT